ncbi:hypothetical protein ACP4OV_031785 [Aristida adscensionis]
MADPFLLFTRERGLPCCIKPSSPPCSSRKPHCSDVQASALAEQLIKIAEDSWEDAAEPWATLAPPVLAAAAPRTFKWRVDGFSSLLEKGEGWTYSRVFEFMDLRWYLKLNPRDRKNDDEEEYVSLMLHLSELSVAPNTVVEACFKFFIYDQCYGKHYAYEVTALGDEGSELADTNGDGISSCKCSELADWMCIKLCVSHDRKYLSLALKMETPDSLPKDSGILVELTVSIKGQKTGKHEELTVWAVPILQNAAIWGYDKFISLEEIKDSSNAGVVESKYCIEAKVEIFGSSFLHD